MQINKSQPLPLIMYLTIRAIDLNKITKIIKLPEEIIGGYLSYLEFGEDCLMGNEKHTL